MATQAETPANGEAVLRLDSLQADILSGLIESFSAAAADPSAREQYARLAAAAANGEITGEMAGRAAAIIEVALSSGRVRNRFGPAAELSLSALYRKTPRAIETAAGVGALNSALARLSGATIGRIALTLAGPGAYTLRIMTDRCELALRLDAAGARLQSLETELA